MKLENSFEVQGHDILVRFENSITDLKTLHSFIHVLNVPCYLKTHSPRMTTTGVSFV